MRHKKFAMMWCRIKMLHDEEKQKKEKQIKIFFEIG